MPECSTRRKLGPAVWTAGAVVCLLLLASLDPAPIHAPLLPPETGHPLGTDHSGRDVLALLARASLTSLCIGVAAALGATGIGALVGGVAGYRAGMVDDLLMRLTDVFLLIPTLPLVVVLTAYVGPGATHTAGVIALTAWPSTARVVRARVLGLREAPFVINARSMGAGSAYLIGRHILPNCGELLRAKTSLAVAGALLAEAGLGFLGLGDPLRPSWGSMIHDAFAAGALVNGYGWWILPPMALICLCTAGFHLAAGSGKDLLPSGYHPAPGPRPPDLVPPHDVPMMAGDLAPPPLLTVSRLTICFCASVDTAPVVDGLDLTVRAGEKIAIVGATGSGKSLLLLAILGLLPPEAVRGGRILIDGEDLARFAPAQRRRFRGVTAPYIPQGAGEALNPVLRVVDQVAERQRRHHGRNRRRAEADAIARLEAVGLSDAVRWARGYPHHLSGGMKQRVLLAMGLAGDPALILADEPTKGLDPESVAGVTVLLRSLEKEAIVAVTHDLAFAAALGGRVVVMYGGMVVENAPAANLLRSPSHPYTRALVAAQPSFGMHPPVPVDVRAGQNGKGCPFRYRCPLADGRCVKSPPLVHSGGHAVRCWCHAA